MILEHYSGDKIMLIIIIISKISNISSWFISAKHTSSHTTESVPIIIPTKDSMSRISKLLSPLRSPEGLALQSWNSYAPISGASP